MNIQDCLKYKNDFIRYLEIEKHLALNTRKSYDLDLAQFINFWKEIQEKEASEIPISKAISRYNTALLHKILDKRSVARKMSCLSSFIRFLKLHDINIEISFERPKIVNKAPEFLANKEIQFLIEELPNKSIPSQKPTRDKLILDILYSTGIRCSEIVNIKIKDIDLTNKKIFINTKNRKSRMVPLKETTESKLVDYIKKECTENGEFLFVNHKNESLTTRSIQRICGMFEKFLTEGKKITPHILRHSFAVHMIEKGTDLKMVEELLGLRTLNVTKQYKKSVQ